MAYAYARQAAAAEEFGDRGAGEDGGAVPQTCRQRPCGGGGGPGQLRDQRDDLGSGRPYGVGGGVRDVLGADDHRAGADVLPVQVDRLLEFAGGVDAGRPGAGDEAGGAGAFAGAGGQDDRAGGECPDALGSYGGEGARARPVERGDAGAQVGSGVDGRVGEEAGVGGAGERVRPVAEAPVGAVPGHSPGRLLALQDLDAGAGRREQRGRGEAGGTGAHHQNVDVSTCHFRASSNNARTAAPQ